MLNLPYIVSPFGNISAAFYSVVDNSGPSGVLALGHARGSTAGILQNNDTIGQIRFAGGDGNDLETTGAQISAEVDGSPASNSYFAPAIQKITRAIYLHFCKMHEANYKSS